MLQRWQITVLGQVQGVGFRNWAQRQASAMGINGYVKIKPMERCLSMPRPTK